MEDQCHNISVLTFIPGTEVKLILLNQYYLGTSLQVTFSLFSFLLREILDYEPAEQSLVSNS
jgi:hypothetical protein